MYLLLAFVNPTMAYLRVTRTDFYPLGPMTPGTLIELLVMAKEDPSLAVYPLAVENPFGRPANYLVYLLNAPAVAAVFTLTNGLRNSRNGTSIVPARSTP